MRSSILTLKKISDPQDKIKVLESWERDGDRLVHGALDERAWSSGKKLLSNCRRWRIQLGMEPRKA